MIRVFAFQVVRPDTSIRFAPAAPLSWWARLPAATRDLAAGLAWAAQTAAVLALLAVVASIGSAP